MPTMSRPTESEDGRCNVARLTATNEQVLHVDHVEQ